MPHRLSRLLEVKVRGLKERQSGEILCHVIMNTEPFADLSLERSITLRWTLRDIQAKRTKLLPVTESDLRLLIERGLVELRDGKQPVLTEAGIKSIEK